MLFYHHYDISCNKCIYYKHLSCLQLVLDIVQIYRYGRNIKYLQFPSIVGPQYLV